jgi:hypothetical protein
MELAGIGVACFADIGMRPSHGDSPRMLHGLVAYRNCTPHTQKIVPDVAEVIDVKSQRLPGVSVALSEVSVQVVLPLPVTVQASAVFDKLPAAPVRTANASVCPDAGDGYTEHERFDAVAFAGMGVAVRFSAVEFAPDGET